jgi:phage terminase Nu1 subunit (DNA packaging protein)
MPKICRYVPNRKKLRVFTAKDVGRIACYALEDGADPAEMRHELQRCLPDDEECECERAKRLLLIGLAVLAFAAAGIAKRSTVGRAVDALRKSPNRTERQLAEAAQKSLDDMLDTIRKNIKELAEEGETVFEGGLTGARPRDIVISP